MAPDAGRLRRVFLVGVCALGASGAFAGVGTATDRQTKPSAVPGDAVRRVERLVDGPIIRPNMDGSMGTNVAGPSLIRVPDWVENRLGKYYLYFADHRGTYIRLAYADSLEGPWSTYEPGTLQLAQSHFLTEAPRPSAYVHVASPDTHVSDERREIVMYFHGRDVGRQATRVATSKDGIHFEARAEILGRPYFRVFFHEGFFYALAMPGFLYRSRDRLSGFEGGLRLFEDDMRHSAVLKRGDTLYVFWTRAGDAPERILLSTIDLAGDWHEWKETDSVEVLRPETEWEGAHLPLRPSRRGAIDVPVNQLRDPAIYEEDGRVYLLYSVAGESGIAIAELHLEPPDR